MNPTKSLVTGAVALSAFASVLGIAYAQVETTEPQSTDQQYQTQSTDPAQTMPADQTLQQQPQSEPATPATPADQQWNQDAASQQEPLPTDPTAAGTPEPRADRN